MAACMPEPLSVGQARFDRGERRQQSSLQDKPDLLWQQNRMRTRLSICARKVRYPSAMDALEAAQSAGLALRPYRCDRCGQFHLTSRTKGKRVPRPA